VCVCVHMHVCKSSHASTTESSLKD